MRPQATELRRLPERGQELPALAAGVLNQQLGLAARLPRNYVLDQCKCEQFCWSDQPGRSSPARSYEPAVFQSCGARKKSDASSAEAKSRRAWTAGDRLCAQLMLGIQW